MKFSQEIPRERWWNVAKDRDPHEEIASDVKQMIDDQSSMEERWLMNARLYTGRKINNIVDMGNDNIYDVFDKKKLVLNVCKSVVNAAVAKIGTNKTRPVYDTEAGNWEQRLKARKLGYFIDGLFRYANFYKTSRDVFRDACTFGPGIVKTYVNWDNPEKPEITIERVLPHEIKYDFVDAKYKNPNRIHHIKEYGREIAQAVYSENSAVLESSGILRTEDYYETTLADPVSIVESWRMPSYKSAKDGRHVISTDNCTLYNESTDNYYYPLSIFNWEEPLSGLFGPSLIDEIVDIQIQINKILLKIEQHMDAASSFILAQRSSLHTGSPSIVKEHLVNTPWSLLEYTGDQPTFASIQSISPEYFAQLDRLYARAFEQAGITQLFAQGQKPEGLESGKALIEYKKTESARFMAKGQAFEEWVLDVASKCIYCAQEIEKRKPGFSVLGRNESGELERIKFRDICLDEDKYVVQPKASSLFPTERAAKFESVKGIAEFDPSIRPYVIKLLDEPDLKAVTKQIYADINHIDLVTDRIIYEGIMEPPDGFTNLEKALTISRNKYHLAKIDNVSEERLELLRVYMKRCEELLNDMVMEEQRRQMEMQASITQPQSPPQQIPQLVQPQAQANTASPSADVDYDRVQTDKLV